MGRWWTQTCTKSWKGGKQGGSRGKCDIDRMGRKRPNRPLLKQKQTQKHKQNPAGCNPPSGQPSPTSLECTLTWLNKTFAALTLLPSFLNELFPWRRQEKGSLIIHYPVTIQQRNWETRNDYSNYGSETEQIYFLTWRLRG